MFLIFAKLNVSQLLLQLLAFVWLALRNESKYILYKYSCFLEQQADLHQAMTFRINNYL